MSSRLAEVVSFVECPRCRAVSWSAGGANGAAALTCLACRTVFAFTDDVLELLPGGAEEGRVVALEREGVRRTERDAALGGINDAFDDLSRAEGALRDAILALPHGNDSRYYSEPGYFANVRSSVAAFDFICRHLDARPGERLIDLGADLTWSTCQMARRGLDCMAVDINHHLSVARLFEQHFGVSYHRVRANMRDVPCRAGSIDIVMAINALHHCDRLEPLAANIARMLKPGGRLAFIEPYCATADAKAAFGRSQIAAGISEQTYLLGEWHGAFSAEGLRVRTLRVSDSFSAVYEKVSGGRGDLFAHFYDGDLSLAGAVPASVRPGTVFEVPIALENRGNAVWCSASQFPVYASYHLSRDSAAGQALVAFDNPRTPLPRECGSGEHLTMRLEVMSPLEPGDYVAEIDLVHEYVSWFAPRGLTSRAVRFTVST